jgi:hypothetical protein
VGGDHTPTRHLAEGTGSAGALRGQPVRRGLAVEPTAQYLTRTTYPEFAFGDTIITLIIARFPKTELTGHELQWTSNVIRGPHELVLRLAS